MPRINNYGAYFRKLPSYRFEANAQKAMNWNSRKYGKVKIKIGLLFSVLLLLISCYRETMSISDLNVGKSILKYDIAIDGFISTENVNCKVMLYKPVLINDVVKRIIITDAVVVLKDGNNAYPFDFIDESRWTGYKSRDKIQGVVGQTYSLEVTYHGKVYTASDVMPDTDDEFNFPISNIVTETQDWLILPPDGIGFNLLKHNFGFNDFMIYQGYYKHQLTGNLYVHRGNIPQGVFPDNGSARGTSLGGNKSDSIFIVKLAISEQYYKSLVTVFNETDWRSGLLSTVPGNVETNVSEGGIGFFYATNVRRKAMTLQELADTKR